MVTASLLIIGFMGFAQEIDLTKGNVSIFNGETTINIEFNYGHISVGKYKNEQEYLTAKTEEYNKKEPGSFYLRLQEIVQVSLHKKAFQPFKKLKGLKKIFLICLPSFTAAATRLNLLPYQKEIPSTTSALPIHFSQCYNLKCQMQVIHALFPCRQKYIPA